MHYSTGDITKYIGKVSAICITTNGFVKHDETCVMGAGIAKTFSDKYPFIPAQLGRNIKKYGNCVHVIDTIEGTDIIAFPTKHGSVTITDINQLVSYKQKDYKVGDKVPGFWCKSDPELIAKSSSELNALMEVKQYKYVILPIPGCSNGGLNFKKDVEPILLKEFSTIESLYIMSYNKKDFI